MDFLFDGRLSVYVFLVGCAIVVAALWGRYGFVLYSTPTEKKDNRKERRRMAYAILLQEADEATPRGRMAVEPIVLLVILGLIVLYFILDLAVDTRNEQIIRKVREMAAAVKKKDTEGIRKHMSEGFRYGTIDRDTFMKGVQKALDDGMVEEIVVWGFAYDNPKQPTVRFSVKAKGGQTGSGFNGQCEAEFVKDPDGQMRMRTFRVYLLSKDEEYELPLAK